MHVVIGDPEAIAATTPRARPALELALNSELIRMANHGIETIPVLAGRPMAELALTAPPRLLASLSEERGAWK
jgi:hypothetical protein